MACSDGSTACSRNWAELMHPAVSVIIFTVLSGCGFGLIFLIGLGWPQSAGPLRIMFVVALAGGLATAGLLASTFHLGRPERAWRAFSQWRTSWLSREGILAVATMLVFGLYLAIWMFTGLRFAVLGWLVSLLSAATVFATAMIYAQLRTVAAWATMLTPATYLGFSLASGLVLAHAVDATGLFSGMDLTRLAILAVALAWTLKLAWWVRANTGFAATGTDAGTATGLGHIGKVRLLERPHTGENYLTREMVHRIGRKHARKLRAIAVICGLLLTFLSLLATHVLAATGMAGIAALLAVLFWVGSLFIERWLFFAEAKHSVSFYYGE